MRVQVCFVYSGDSQVWFQNLVFSNELYSYICVKAKGTK